jgi:phosphate transport system substrate-binding protein
MLIGQTHAQTLINGAGSTFDYPAFAKWIEAYGQHDSDARINYQSLGSGAGQKQLLNQTVAFGASDAPMTDDAMSQAPGKILHIPVLAGGVAIIYNLPGSPKLKVDSDVIADIYLGNITKWNDPKIGVLNPGLSLPALPIVPVHRSDGSGTTFICSDYLSAVNPMWAKTVGIGTSVRWPNVGVGAKGSEGVAGQVKQLPGAVGYAELAYADQNKIPYAEVKNAAGNFVSPTPASVSAALANAKIPDDFRFSMVNAPGENAYPIAGASWVLVYQQQQDAERAKKLVAFLKWAVTDGQKISATLDYAPLPENVQRRVLDLIGSIKY